MKIDQTVNRIADAQFRSVVDLSNATGKQSGVIKVNHNTYNVSVGKDGTVDVSFRGGWFNFCRKNSLERMRHAMQTQYNQFKRDYDATVSRPDNYDSFEDQFSPAIKTARNETEAVITNRFGADAGHQEVVLYGFGDEEWIDMGAPGHRTAFLMLIHALADGVPDFADKVNAVRTELEGIPDETFAQHEANGLGDTIRNYLCYDIVPEE